MEHVAKLPLDYLLAAFAVIFALGLIVFVIAAGVLAGALKNIRGVLTNAVEQHDVRIPNQPVGVAVQGAVTTREHTEFATREELEAVGAQVTVVDTDLKSLRKEIVANGELRRASIEAKVEAVRMEMKGDIKGVHDRINVLVESVGELNGKVSA